MINLFLYSRASHFHITEVDYQFPQSEIVQYVFFSECLKQTLKFLFLDSGLSVDLGLVSERTWTWSQCGPGPGHSADLGLYFQIRQQRIAAVQPLLKPAER